jgi:ATP synthase protein I
MSDDRPDALSALDERIRAAKQRQAPPPPKEDHYSQAEQGWRMVIELVTGILIGFGIGYGLDALFGTIPIFLILFTLLGFVAGVKTMMRTATDFQRKREAEEAAKKG